jgi:hypothetical protein
MLVHIIAALGPLKFVAAGLLFLNIAWVAARKWMLVGVISLSAAEILLPQLWEWTGGFVARLARSEPAFTPAGGGTGAGSAIAILLAHALLATVIWLGVRALQHWARATMSYHQRRLIAMIEDDERRRRARQV